MTATSVLVRHQGLHPRARAPLVTPLPILPIIVSWPKINCPWDEVLQCSWERFRLQIIFEDFTLFRDLYLLLVSKRFSSTNKL